MSSTAEEAGSAQLPVGRKGMLLDCKKVKAVEGPPTRDLTRSLGFFQEQWD